MRHLTIDGRAWAVLALVEFLSGCSGTESNVAASGGSLAVGGASQSGGAVAVGAAASSGGGAATTVMSAGGSLTTGGGISSGGQSAAGGFSATGASVATGGTVSVGGTTATGGTKSGGGQTSTGGMQATGGSKATGSTTATGGSKATGGTMGTGGSKATGGTSNTGGASATGGQSTTGGSTAASTSSCITKRGFASGLEISSAAADIAALAAPEHGVSWYYGWALRPSTQMGTAFLDAGVEFVPMVWGHPDELTDTNLASKIYVGSNTKHLLGFNEPNFNSQANLSPAQAAAAWPNVEKAAKELKLELVAPAVNFCGSGCTVKDPFEWVDQFLAACTNCKIDYVAFHSYACDSNWFINSYAKKAVEKYYTNGNPKRKVWFTELGCADGSGSVPNGGWTVAQIQSYQNTVLAYFENEPGIYRYSWFGDRTGRPSDPNYVSASNSLLATGSSSLTALGQTYTSMAEANSCP